MKATSRVIGAAVGTTLFTALLVGCGEDEAPVSRSRTTTPPPQPPTRAAAAFTELLRVAEALRGSEDLDDADAPEDFDGAYQLEGTGVRVVGFEREGATCLEDAAGNRASIKATYADDVETVSGYFGPVCTAETTESTIAVRTDFGDAGELGTDAIRTTVLTTGAASTAFARAYEKSLGPQRRENAQISTANDAQEIALALKAISSVDEPVPSSGDYPPALGRSTLRALGVRLNPGNVVRSYAVDPATRVVSFCVVETRTRAWALWDRGTAEGSGQSGARCVASYA